MESAVDVNVSVLAGTDFANIEKSTRRVQAKPLRSMASLPLNVFHYFVVVLVARNTRHTHTRARDIRNGAVCVCVWAVETNGKYCVSFCRQ